LAGALTEQLACLVPALLGPLRPVHNSTIAMHIFDQSSHRSNHLHCISCLAVRDRSIRIWEKSRQKN
jgi:hypothetical protein